METEYNYRSTSDIERDLKEEYGTETSVNQLAAIFQGFTDKWNVNIEDLKWGEFRSTYDLNIIEKEYGTILEEEIGQEHASNVPTDSQEALG